MEMAERCGFLSTRNGWKSRVIGGGERCRVQKMGGGAAKLKEGRQREVEIDKGRMEGGEEEKAAAVEKRYVKEERSRWRDGKQWRDL